MKKVLNFIGSVLLWIAKLLGVTTPSLPPGSVDITNGQIKEEYEETLPGGGNRKVTKTVTGDHIRATPKQQGLINQ